MNRSPHPRPPHRVAQHWAPAWGRAARGVLGALCLSLVGLGSATAATATAPATTASLADLQAQATAQKQQVELLLGRKQAAEQAQKRRQEEAARLAAEIEQQKGQPESVARDLSLNDKLAQAQAQAGVLLRGDAALRQGAEELRAARARLVSLCDRILSADDSSLSAGQRLLWLRLRTAQVEALLADKGVGSSVALPSAASPSSPASDDPQLLREQADLLRDSVDKLRREVARLEARGEELRRRERLREQAHRVDEDLFAEQATARRKSSGTALRATGGAEAAPAADATTGVATAPSSPSSTATFGSTPRTGPDPSTLDSLLRSEGSGDPALKQQALQRARGELEALAAQLLRRAMQLEQRATDLSRQK